MNSDSENNHSQDAAHCGELDLGESQENSVVPDEDSNPPSPFITKNQDPSGIKSNKNSGTQVEYAEGVYIKNTFQYLSQERENPAAFIDPTIIVHESPKGEIAEELIEAMEEAIENFLSERLLLVAADKSCPAYNERFYGFIDKVKTHHSTMQFRWHRKTFDLAQYCQCKYDKPSITYLNWMDCSAMDIEAFRWFESISHLREALRSSNNHLIILCPVGLLQEAQAMQEAVYTLHIPRSNPAQSPEIEFSSNDTIGMCLKFIAAFFPGLSREDFFILSRQLINALDDEGEMAYIAEPSSVSRWTSKPDYFLQKHRIIYQLIAPDHHGYALEKSNNSSALRDYIKQNQPFFLRSCLPVLNGIYNSYVINNSLFQEQYCQFLKECIMLGIFKVSEDWLQAGHDAAIRHQSSQPENSATYADMLAALVDQPYAKNAISSFIEKQIQNCKGQERIWIACLNSSPSTYTICIARPDIRPWHVEQLMHYHPEDGFHHLYNLLGTVYQTLYLAVRIFTQTGYRLEWLTALIYDSDFSSILSKVYYSPVQEMTELLLRDALYIRTFRRHLLQQLLSQNLQLAKDEKTVDLLIQTIQNFIEENATLLTQIEDKEQLTYGSSILQTFLDDAAELASVFHLRLRRKDDVIKDAQKELYLELSNTYYWLTLALRRNTEDDTLYEANMLRLVQPLLEKLLPKEGRILYSYIGDNISKLEIHMKNLCSSSSDVMKSRKVEYETIGRQVRALRVLKRMFVCVD